jgi:hypothetical protein
VGVFIPAHGLGADRVMCVQLKIAAAIVITLRFDKAKQNLGA